MNKIGIKITKISAGVQELETFNGGDWTRKVSDIRTDMKSLSGKALEDGAPVLMLSFLLKGSLTTVCRAIPGRAGDLVSVWIHIPAEIAISAEEECAIIEQVKAELAKPNVASWDALGQLCEKEYPLKPNPYTYIESNSANPCAVRYYGPGTDFGLRELLGDRRYQSYYAEHRYVFLLDRNAGITADDKLVNYTDEPVREHLVSIPPQLPAGITLLLNGKEFVSPIVLLRDDKILLTYERQGFNSVSYNATAGGPMPDPADIPWKRHLTPNLFQVRDNEGKNLNGSCLISLKGQRLTPNGLDIPEEECKAVKVDVDCPDCEPYSNTLNLLGQPPFPIVMEKEKLEVVYRLNGKECPGLTECPTGYACTKTRRGKKVICDCYYVEPETGPNWKLFTIIGSTAALLIGLALGMLLHKILDNRAEKQETEYVQPEQQDNREKVNQPSSSTPAATVYDCLNKDTWKKAEIDLEPDLQGFFRDVQKCNVGQLTGKWAEKIDPKVHPQWASLLIEIKKYDADLLKDFQMGNNDQEIQLAYYTKKLNDWVSALGQSGSAAPANPPARKSQPASSTNKTNSGNTGGTNNSTDNKKNNNGQRQDDL